MSARPSATPVDLAGDIVRRCVLLAGFLAVLALVAILAARTPSDAADFGTIKGWLALSDAGAFFLISTMLERVAAARRRAANRPEPTRLRQAAITAAQIASFLVPLLVIRSLLGPG